MAWQNANLTRTLRIVEVNRSGKKRYMIDPMVKVVRMPGGDTFMEPLPGVTSGELGGTGPLVCPQAFDAVEFVSDGTYATKRDTNASELTLIRMAQPTTFVND